MVTRYASIPRHVPIEARSSGIKILRISLPQLQNLPASDIRLGGLPLKDWNSQLIAHFHEYRDSSPEVRANFDNLIQLLNTKPDLRGSLTERIKGSLAQQILARFTAAVADITGDPRLENWAYVFISLKTLSLAIIGDQNDPAALAEKIRENNKGMETIAQALNLPYQVKVE